MIVLAGDIGGTNARLALVELDDGVRIVAEETRKSRSITSPVAFIREFLGRGGSPPERGCLGIAGPVVDGMVSGTNLPWVLEAAVLGREIGINGLILINDFEAAAHGLSRLSPDQLLTLQAGEPDPEGAVALIGAGTGLGQGLLVRQGTSSRVIPSEGGHSTFAAEDPRGWALYNFLAERYGTVSWERVVSGPGLVECFEFVAAGRESAAQAPVRAEFAEEDAAAVITRHALAGTDPLAAEALELFVDAYGAQAGNLALTALATGGVYVGGGIARKISGVLADGRFLRAFLRKGRMTALLQRIPVQVILSPDVALIGAAVVAGMLADS